MIVPVLKADDSLSNAEQSLIPVPQVNVPMEVSVHDNLDALPRPILSLFEEAGEQDFFLTKEWFHNFKETALLPNDRVRIYAVAGAPDQMVADGLFLARTSEPKKKWETGHRLFSLTNYYSCFFAPHLRSNSSIRPQALR